MVDGEPERGVTPWQLTAIQNPCLLAEETVHPRFCHDGRNVRVILTVNSGYE